MCKCNIIYFALYNACLNLFRLHKIRARRNITSLSHREIKDLPDRQFDVTVADMYSSLVNFATFSWLSIFQEDDWIFAFASTVWSRESLSIRSLVVLKIYNIRNVHYRFLMTMNIGTQSMSPKKHTIVTNWSVADDWQNSKLTFMRKMSCIHSGLSKLNRQCAFKSDINNNDTKISRMITRRIIRIELLRIKYNM